jgi:hypothetical protein
MTIAADTDRGNNGNNPRPRSRALELLRRIVSSGSVETQALAHALVVRPATLDSYICGTVPIPLERQLCLALYLIEHVPELARQGHQLRGQVAAAIAFQEHATVVHSDGPPTHF